MRARVFCPVGELQLDRTFGAEAILGRSPLVTIELPPRLLSAQHARIAWNEERGCYMLEDLNSSNGTRLDGEVVNEPRPLGHMHVITLAEVYDLVFQDLDRCAARHSKPVDGSTSVSRTNIEVLNLPLPGLLRSEKTPAREKTLFQRFSLPVPDLLRGRPAESPSPKPAADLKPAAQPSLKPVPAEPDQAEPAPAEPVQAEPVQAEPASPWKEASASMAVRTASWWLELLDLDAGPHRVQLREGDNLVGRSSDCDIVVAGAEASRRHANLSVREGRLFLRDLGSSNKTFLDDEEIDREVELTPGGRIRFGAIAARVVVGRISEDGRLLADGESE